MNERQLPHLNGLKMCCIKFWKNWAIIVTLVLIAIKSAIIVLTARKDERMKRDEIILLLTALTLAELTLLVVLAYRFYQIEQPQIQQLKNAGSGISGFLSLFSKKPT